MKKIIIIIVGVVILAGGVLTLTGCGNKETNNSGESSNTGDLTTYYGEYVNNSSGETISISKNGVSYNGTTMAIESINGNRMILSGTNIVFIVSATSIDTNIAHINDNSYLDTFTKKVIDVKDKTTSTNNTPTKTEQSTTATSITGTYRGSNPLDSFELHETEVNGYYQLINIWIDNPIYYKNGVRISGSAGHCNEMSEALKLNVGSVTEFTTYYGYEGKITVNNDGSISLILKNSENLEFSGKFTK